ncbi:MAG: hypothetical protein WD844_12295 [Thermoleophilaceae bacterium]
MTGEGPPAPGEPPVQPDDAPASVGQLRTLRRWVAVAGVWAVAATAVALIALIDASGDEPRDEENGVAADIGELQRSLDERLAELERGVRDAASGEDLQRLDNRLGELEDDVSSASQSAADAADAADAIGNRVDDLEGRVEALESDAGNDGGDGGQP